MKAPDFNVNDYHELVKIFGKCRRTVNHYEISEKLMLVKPNGEIPYDLKDHIKKYCETGSTWGGCVEPAKQIWDLLFKNQ